MLAATPPNPEERQISSFRQIPVRRSQRDSPSRTEIGTESLSRFSEACGGRNTLEELPARGWSYPRHPAKNPYPPTRRKRQPPEYRNGFESNLLLHLSSCPRGR